MDRTTRAILKFIVKVAEFWIIGSIIRTIAWMIKDPWKRLTFLTVAGIVLALVWILWLR